MKTAKSADFSDMVKLISHSADETEQIGEKIAKKLHGTEVIALFGGLGMGYFRPCKRIQRKVQYLSF